MVPKLSIVIPIYNASAYLHQTLDSVLNQSLKDIEVICVDDGSTDDSLDIIKEYAKNDNRVKVLQQKNQYAGAARNAGIAEAKGEYIHFLNANDYVLDYAYEALYNKAVKYDLDCLKFSCVCYDDAQNAVVNVPEYTFSSLEAGYFIHLLTLDEGSPLYNIGVDCWNGIYRRSFLAENGIKFNELLGDGERDFFCRVITGASRIMLARDWLVVHKVKAASSETTDELAKKFNCIFKSVEAVGAQMLENEVDAEVSRRIMDMEFKHLLDSCAAYQDDPKCSDYVLSETEKFINNYSGLYPERLYKLYQKHFGDADKGNGSKAEDSSQTEPFFPAMHESCPEPKVSVVVPIYNVEDYLNEALYSLSVQTLDEMEFICVNDGSTDNCMTIIREYANLDKRFIILDGPNGGYGKAMNRGIDAARGQYLGILEPDDFVPMDMYRSLYDIAAEKKLDLIKADFYRFSVNNNGTINKELAKLTKVKSNYNRVVNTSKDIKTFRFIMNTWSGIYNLDFLNKWNIRHNETPGASYQDNGFWFQTFCRATRAWFVNKPFYMNRRDNPNSSVYSRKKIYCITDEYKYIWNWLNTDPELVKKFASIFYLKKFDNFITTYRRLLPEDQLEYLHHICDEFKPAMEAGFLDKSLFGASDWNQLNEILADPEAYYNDVKVSVVIPVYNSEKYIRKTLDSLLKLSEIPFEVICVDDGSTDNSLDILRQYEQNDSRVRVITQTNGGAGAARNTGLKYARGKYLSFLDADDFFDQHMLKIAYDQASVNNSDITVFRSDQYMEDIDEYRPMQYTIMNSLLPAKRPFAGLDIQRNIFKAFVGWAWDKLFLTEFVRENNLQFQEIRTTNDMFFVFCAIVKAKRITTMNNVLAHHRRNSGSLSVTREKSWDCSYRALCALRQQLRDWNLYDRLEQDFINYCQHAMLWNVTSIQGPAYYKFYDKLVTEWADDLGIKEHGENYFYDAVEYEKMQTLLSHSSEDFLFWQLNDAKKQINDLNLKNRELRDKLANIRNSATFRVGRHLVAPMRFVVRKLTILYRSCDFIMTPLRKLKRSLKK